MRSLWWACFSADWGTCQGRRKAQHSKLLKPKYSEPTQPPSPASSTQVSQSFGPTSAGSLQSLSSTLLCGSASGLLVSSSVSASGSLGSASSCLAHHYTSACQPVGSTLAPPSLLTISSTGFPRPSGVALVSCRSSCATDFRAFQLCFVPPPL